MTYIFVVVVELLSIPPSCELLHTFDSQQNQQCMHAHVLWLSRPGMAMKSYLYG